MNYGLYLSASGVLTNLYRQDVFANNLANVQTVGFKPDVPAIRQRHPESVEDGLGRDVSKRLLDRLGGGALAGPQRINFGAGPLQQTSNQLDVALEDEHSFFVVRSKDPDTQRPVVRLTRDGRFTVSPERQLVTQSGLKVLDPSDQPIVIGRDGEVRIDNAGRVRQGDQVIGQIQVAQVADPGVLRKRGGNLFAFEGPDPRQVLTRPSVRPAHIEASGVDPIQELMRLVAATKAAMGSATMIRYFDLLMDRSVNTLGRVA